MKKGAKEPISRADMEKYQAERQGLEAEVLDEILLSRKRGWQVGLGGFTFGILSLFVMGFVIYRYSQPVPAHLLVLNPATNSIEQVSLLTPQTTYGEQNDTFWVSRFVTSFESYDFNAAQVDYNTVGLMSSSAVADLYSKRYKWGTSQAADKVLGDSENTTVKIASVILDRENSVATVRFSTTKKFRTRPGSEPSQYWIATVAYTYDNVLLKAAERYINPLGFRVLSYRVNAEAAGNVGG